MEKLLKEYIDWMNETYKETKPLSPLEDGTPYVSKYFLKEGKKYIKVIHRYGYEGLPSYCGSKATDVVYGFICKNTGNLLKANSWRAPHPTPRGNIFLKDKWKTFGSKHGYNYITPKWVNEFVKTGNWSLIKS